MSDISVEKVEILKGLNTPCYVIDEQRLVYNGEILKDVAAKSGARILLAQKAFSNYDFYPLLSKYIAGTEASGLYEARLGAEYMPDGENHVFCAAYKDEDFDEVLKYSNHIVFNSVAQLRKFGYKAKLCGKSIGLRINPECSTQEGHAIYDPCSSQSRLGVTRSEFNRQMNDELIGLIDGLHFHTLCEQNADSLEITLQAVEQKYGDILSLDNIRWINMGGGHHITRENYNRDLLIQLIINIKAKYKLDNAYLEPGEAVALNAGYLVTEVLDIVNNGNNKIAIIDASAACHMPDVIEMPYLPPLLGAIAVENQAECGSNEYILAGPTCLAGDSVGKYIFENELHIGDKLIFKDMAIYTTVKNNTFNGMKLPSIYSLGSDMQVNLIKSFDYDDFRERLGK
ncbi:MAG: carboxynorspermidine decarboxylase [Clostridia bacterium]|nr:carboxynorspermidine decarboxylase [Clostridia bacterium]